MQSRQFTFSCREVPLRVSQASSGTGGLTSVTSNGSYSAANSVNIDPYNVGGRMAEVSAVFTKYRIKRLRIRYLPDTTMSGVTDLVAGPSGSPNYVSRTFAWGFNRDPALSTLNYTQLIQMGGSVGNTAKPQTLTFVNNDPAWFFTSTTASSPTTIDLRLVAPLQLRFAYFNTSTTATASYGHLVFDMVVQFQGPIANSGPLGFTSLQSTVESKEDEKKSDLRDVQGGLSALGLEIPQLVRHGALPSTVEPNSDAAAIKH